MDGLVYYAVCSSCGEAASRSVARGPDATYAVRVARRHARLALPGGKYANPVVADGERIYITGRAHEYALARKGSKVGQGVPESAIGKAARKRQRAVTSRRTSREASGSPLDLKRVVEALSSSTSSAAFSGSCAVAPGRVGRAADQQRRRRGRADRLGDLRPVEQRREPDAPGPLTSVAATLPSDLPITTTRSAPAAASSARSAWPRIHSNGSWSRGARSSTSTTDQPPRLRRLAREPEQRRLAEVADARAGAPRSGRGHPRAGARSDPSAISPATSAPVIGHTR